MKGAEEGREIWGCWGIGRAGVGNNAILSVRSDSCKDILGVDKDLNVSRDGYSV